MGREYNEPWEQCDITAFASGIKGDGVISGLAVTEKGTPDMGVAVAAGSCIIGGTTYTEGSSFNLGIDNGHAIHDRKDLITYDASAGDPAVVKGTAATPPLPPAIPSGDILLAVVLVEATESTSIMNSDITEGRVTVIPLANNDVRDMVEAADNSNTFTDTDHTKLNGVEAGATKYPDTGEQAFLDADHTKLNGVEAGATADQTGAEIKTLYEIEALLLRYTIGSAVLKSHPTAVNNNNTTYMKQLSIELGTLSPSPATLRVRFNLACANGHTAHGRIYKNGSPYGTERSVNSDTLVSFTEDLSFAEGDIIQIYLKIDNSLVAYWTHSYNGFAVLGTTQQNTLQDVLDDGKVGFVLTDWVCTAP